MRLIQRFLIAMILLVGINTTNIFAEDTITSELQSLDQKVEAIKAQINMLDKKGIENLSDKEIDKYLELQDQLLTAKDEIIVIENKKQSEENKKQKAYDRVIETLDSVKKSLPPLNSSK